MLESRISLCERCAQLSNGSRHLQDDALQLAVTSIIRANLDLPLNVRFDLAQRHSNLLWSKIMAAAGGRDEEKRDTEIQGWVDFLIPAKALRTDKDDTLRPSFSNMVKIVENIHIDEMETCEMSDELLLQEAHTEQWQATSCIEFHCFE